MSDFLMLFLYILASSFASVVIFYFSKLKCSFNSDFLIYFNYF